MIVEMAEWIGNPRFTWKNSDSWAILQVSNVNQRVPSWARCGAVLMADFISVMGRSRVVKLLVDFEGVFEVSGPRPKSE
jgi:hypothetical protein